MEQINNCNNEIKEVTRPNYLAKEYVIYQKLVEYESDCESEEVIEVPENQNLFSQIFNANYNCLYYLYNIFTKNDV
jgi:hypothetical protein